MNVEEKLRSRLEHLVSNGRIPKTVYMNPKLYSEFVCEFENRAIISEPIKNEMPCRCFYRFAAGANVLVEPRAWSTDMYFVCENENGIERAQRYLKEGDCHGFEFK